MNAAAIIKAIQWISLGVRAGMEVHAALKELRERIEARGDAFDWTDVDFFKQKAIAASAESQAAINAMPD